MTENQINEKALEVYPEIYVQTPYCMSTYDVNEDHRGGYKKALNDIESLPKIKGWVARDKDGGLFIGERKPYRNEFETWVGYGRSVKLFNELLPELTWEDEPIEVELIIRKI